MTISSPQLRSRRSFHAQRAFSLTELIVVMGVMGVLAAFSVPALSGFMGSSYVTTAGIQFSDILQRARVEASSRQTRVRLRVATDWPALPEMAYRGYSLWALTPGEDPSQESSWQALTPWESLPNHVRFVPEAPHSHGGIDFFAPSHLSTENVMAMGSPIEVATMEFKPSGSLVMRSPQPLLILRIAPSKGDTLTNWSDISIHSLTGKVRLLRPDTL